MSDGMQAAVNRTESVQTFGRKKNSVAVAHVKSGSGLIKVNGQPLELRKPQALRYKNLEPFLLIGFEKAEELDIRVRVKGGGKVSQTYAVRQAIAKGILSYYKKFKSETMKAKMKAAFLSYDRTLVVADPRRCESKKFGGPGARARYQKSYR